MANIILINFAHEALHAYKIENLVMMPKVVGVVLDQMTRIVRFWSFAFLNNSIIAVQEKIPLYKVLKMLFRESAMDS